MKTTIKKTVNLDARIHKRVSIQAVKESKTIESVVNRLIESGLKYEQALKAR